MRAIENRPSTKRPPFRQFLKSGGDRYNWFTTLCVSLHGAAEEVLWPLFIFVLFGTVQSVALLAAITSVGTVIFSYLTGKLSRLHPLRLIALGSLFIALTWTVRLGTDNPTVHYGSLLVMGFFTLLVAIPTESRLIMRAKESEPLSVMAYRNAVSMSAPLVLFVVLGTLSEVFRNGFTAAAAGMFSLLLVTTVFALRERRIRASTSRP